MMMLFTAEATNRFPDRERALRQLDAWLGCWHAYLAIEDDEPVPCAYAEAAAAPGGEPEADPLMPGDIRLLPPSLCPDAVRYIALLGPEDADAQWAVPFALFDKPATDKEWQLDRAFPLAVLCLWNRLHLPRSVLETTWVVDKLSEPELRLLDTAVNDDAAALRKDLRLGPPLHHPLDPRHDYLDRETAFRERVEEAAGEARIPERGPVFPVSVASELRLAAEKPSSEYGKKTRRE